MKRIIPLHFASTLAISLACLLLTSCATTQSPKISFDFTATPDPAKTHQLQALAESHAHFAAAIIHEVNEESAAAYNEFFLAAKLNPTDTDLLAEVSNRLIEGRQFDRALQVLRWAAELPNADDMLFVRLGFVYSQLGDNAKAIEANREAIRRMPKMLALRQNLFLNHISAKQPEAALAVLNEAAAEPDTDAEFLSNLAELYANLGRQFPEQRLAAGGKALEVLNRASTRSPLPVPVQLKLGDGFNLLGDKNNAVKMYLEVLDHASPTSPLQEILRSKLVDIFLRGSDHARAVDQIKAILRDNPKNAAAHYFLGSIAFDQKRWDAAAESFAKAIEVNPAIEQAHYDLASAHIAAGRGGDALKVLDEARKRFAENFPLEFLTGLACHEQKQHEKALSHFAAAERIALAGETNRLNAGFYFQMGAASERAGKFTDAEKHFERSIALTPKNVEAMNYLGYMWAERGENLTRAYDLIEAALKLEPDNDAFLDSMGWVMFKLGDFNGATEYLLKAIAKLEKPDATVYDHLGDAYAAAKALDKARDAWAKSVSIEPNEAVQMKLDAATKELSR